MSTYTIIRKSTKIRRNHISTSLFKAATQSIMVQGNSGQHASVLVHEMRDPLSNINLAVEMLQSMIKEDDQLIYLDIILRGSVRINDMVIELLTSCERG